MKEDNEYSLLIKKISGSGRNPPDILDGLKIKWQGVTMIHSNNGITHKEVLKMNPCKTQPNGKKL